MEDVKSYVECLAKKAKAASKSISQMSAKQRCQILQNMSRDLILEKSNLLEANMADVEAARKCSTADSVIDRLLLTEDRIDSMANALLDLADFPDILGESMFKSTLENGLVLNKIRVSLGLVAIIYEARPNVTVDAIGICIKSGNACILRGGTLAKNSAKAIALCLQKSLSNFGFNPDAIAYIDTDDRQASLELMKLHGIVDVLIPRGGSQLIQLCVENSTVPVIETGTGNCHVYIDESANVEMAKNIIVNAKCRRVSVCNACETLIINKHFPKVEIVKILEELCARGVVLHVDKYIEKLCLDNSIPSVCASEDDYYTEYLSLDLAVAVVENTQEAIEHIDKYSSRHSEAIVTENAQSADLFASQVDSAVVYINASTAFSDGGEFGLCAEIGISTQKMHVRGPFSVEGLTTYKYLVQGNGQIRQ